MKKGTKSILAGTGALVLLSGALVALKLTEPSDSVESNTDATESDKVSTLLWEKDPATVKQISVQNTEDSYEVNAVITETVNEETGEAEEDRSYVIKGCEELSYDTLVNTFATKGSTITTVDTIAEHASDLSIYGLAEPSATVTLTYDDDSQTTFYIGDVSPLSTETYFMQEGDETVYTVQTNYVSTFLQKPEYFVSKTLEPALAEDDTTVLEQISIDRQDLEYTLLMEYDHFYDELENGGTAAYHKITSPVVCYLNPEYSADTTSAIFGLAADEVVQVHPTKEKLAACGFDDPFCTVSFTTDAGRTMTLQIGDTYALSDEETTDTYYYAYYSEYDVLYGFLPDSLPWEDVQIADIASKLVFTTYVWDVGELEISAPDMEPFVLTGQGSSKDDFIAKLNGKEIDVERFRTFYTFILKTYAEDILLDGTVPNEEPLASITMKRQDGLQTQVVEFYESEGLKVLIVVDGEPVFKCRKAFVDTLLHNCEIFETDEAFTTHW